jgi:hypothetical protein
MGEVGSRQCALRDGRVQPDAAGRRSLREGVGSEGRPAQCCFSEVSVCCALGPREPHDALATGVLVGAVRGQQHERTAASPAPTIDSPAI